MEVLCQGNCNKWKCSAWPVLWVARDFGALGHGPFMTLGNYFVSGWGAFFAIFGGVWLWVPFFSLGVFLVIFNWVGCIFCGAGNIFSWAGQGTFFMVLNFRTVFCHFIYLQNFKTPRCSTGSRKFVKNCCFFGIFRFYVYCCYVMVLWCCVCVCSSVW